MGTADERARVESALRELTDARSVLLTPQPPRRFDLTRFAVGFANLLILPVFLVITFLGRDEDDAPDLLRPPERSTALHEAIVRVRKALWKLGLPEHDLNRAIRLQGLPERVLNPVAPIWVGRRRTSRLLSHIDQLLGQVRT